MCQSMSFTEVMATSTTTRNQPIGLRKQTSQPWSWPQAERCVMRLSKPYKWYKAIPLLRPTFDLPNRPNLQFSEVVGGGMVETFALGGDAPYEGQSGGETRLSLSWKEDVRAMWVCTWTGYDTSLIKPPKHAMWLFRTRGKDAISFRALQFGQGQAEHETPRHWH